MQRFLVRLSHLPLPARMAGAAALFAVALLLRWALFPLGSGPQFFSFYPAMVTGFFFFGFLPGCLVTVASVAAVLNLFSPVGPTTGSWLSHAATPLSFLLTAALTAALSWRLRRSEGLFREIVQDQTDAIARFHPDGTVTFANAAFLQLCGRAEEQVLGRRWQDLRLYEDATELDRLLRLLTPGSPVLPLERAFRGEGAEAQWAQFVHRGLFSVRGQLLGVQVVARETTQSKWLEAHLQEAASELEVLYDRAPCGYFSCTAELRLTRLNALCRDWLGLGRGEIALRPDFAAFLSPASREALLTALRALEPSATLAPMDLELHGQNQPVRVVSLSTTCAWDAEGRLLTVDGVLFDVTRLRATENALQRVHAEQEAVINNDLLAIARIRQRRVVWASAGLARLLDRSRDELIGMSTRELLVTDDAYLDIGTTAYAEIRAGRTWQGEVELRRRDGSSVWLDARGIGFDPQAEETLWLYNDITRRKEMEHALRASQSFLARTGAVAGVGGWQVDLLQGTAEWSDEACRLHDLPPGTPLQLPQLLEFHAPEAQPLIEQAVRDAIGFGAPWDLELPMVSASGRRFWVRSVGAVEYEQGQVARLIGAFQDITERRRMATALSESQALLEVTLESIGDAVITTDDAGRVNWLNPVAEALTGWRKDQAVERLLKDIFRVIDDEERALLPDPVERCLDEGKIIGLSPRTLLIARDGREYGIEDSIAPIRNDDGQIIGTVLVFRDVSEQRRLVREVEYRATHDPLTDLHNRADFEARLGRLVADVDPRTGPHALLYIDLDQFKQVNDACGHAVGDQLLRQIAIMFRQSVRNGDIMARLGGDEFAALLLDCPLEQARALAGRICERMNGFRFYFEGHRFRVGTSIGLVPIDGRWTSAAGVIEAADAACFAAKEAGRNQVSLWVDADSNARRRRGEMQWSERLDQAMGRDEFRLFAQQVHGDEDPPRADECEILLRLDDGDGRVCLPGAFMPPALRYHVMRRVDAWVVARVLQHLAAPGWPDGALARVSVNLSGQSIGDRAFHAEIAALLAAAPAAAARLCFELDESATVANLVDARAFIDAVRPFGVRIVLDDFGTGTASFSWLQGLPIDAIKIDPLVCSGAQVDPLHRASVRSFVEVAQVLGIRLIAKSVETEEQRQALAALGIGRMQGHLFHRPEPLAELLARRSAAVPWTRDPLAAALER